MKKIEEKREAVINYCEHDMQFNDDGIYGLWEGAAIRLKGDIIHFQSFKQNPLEIGYLPLDFFEDLYRWLGLEARAERERAAKLIKVLEEIDHICFEVAENPDYTFADKDAELLHGIASRGIENYKKGDSNA